MSIDKTKYCVFLNNWPFVNNKGYLGMCCKNGKILFEQYNIKNTPLKEMWNNPELQKQRDIIASGEMPVGCDICFNYEKNVNPDTSFRMKSLLGLQNKSEIYTLRERNQPFKDQKIRALDLRIGSTCNLVCSMCHPNDSSKWHGVYADFNKAVIQSNPNWINTILKSTSPNLLDWAEHDSSWENIFNSIDSELKRVYLAGGEPFYIKKFSEYVSKLLEYSPNAFIDINTNGTRLLNKSQLNHLAGKVNLRISIDGYGDSEEYQRRGTNWEEKIKVIDQYVKHFNVTSFDITLTLLTIRSLPTLIQFLSFRYPNIKLMVRPVTNRVEQQISELPDHLKQDVLNFLYISKHEIDNKSQIINLLERKTNHEHKKRIQNFVTYWDSISDKNLDDWDPELAEWIFDNA